MTAEQSDDNHEQLLAVVCDYRVQRRVVSADIDVVAEEGRGCPDGVRLGKSYATTSTLKEAQKVDPLCSYHEVRNLFDDLSQEQKECSYEFRKVRRISGRRNVFECHIDNVLEKGLHNDSRWCG